MRARNIKPGFYKNEELAECSPWARLIFPGLWMMADRLGRMEYRPKRIKAEVLPFDAENIEPMVEELERHGLIMRYAVDGKVFLWIPNFHKHQRPHDNETLSVIPPHPADPAPFPEQGKKKPKGNSGSKQVGTDLQPRSEELATKVESVCGQGQHHFALNPSSLNPESEILGGPEAAPPSGGDFSGYSIFHAEGAMHIRQNDFDAWQRAYCHLDLGATLQALSDWTRSQKPTDRWPKRQAFHACSAALKKKNDKAAQEAKERESQAQFPTRHMVN